MKKRFYTALAGAAVLAISGAVQAAPMMTTYLTATPVNDTGLYNIDIYATASGTSGIGGDGGIAGFQFDVVSNGNAKPLQQGPVGPNALKAKTTFDSTITSNFSTIVPSLADNAGVVVTTAANAGNARQALGGSFYDGTAFSNTTMGLSGYAHIATEQWQILDTGKDTPFTLGITGATSYDYGNAGNNYHDDIAAVTATGVTIPAVPEPASLSLLGLGAMGLIARRRRV